LYERKAKVPPGDGYDDFDVDGLIYSGKYDFTEYALTGANRSTAKTVVEPEQAVLGRWHVG
jgi:hypothetical protein